jgi:hypothetical protein
VIVSNIDTLEEQMTGVQSTLETEDELSWKKLKKATIARYGGRWLENPFKEFATLKHSGRVE